MSCFNQPEFWVTSCKELVCKSCLPVSLKSDLNKPVQKKYLTEFKISILFHNPFEGGLTSLQILIS